MYSIWASICKHCKDPEVVHAHDMRRLCMISDCHHCPGYERDNLNYLEYLVNNNDTRQ